ncbi:hypothetical protein COU76_00140 [Candidatus Peregrinibacteria bacterium CG10_big_fil_rev_8_21_14_0_10_49_10]|nr:MAG: hypothetical protein COU76_00140 [Candidatus Peregrinibacteria bacterium CG10_big_fil_rev_8_21_14_0_10_49_10]
MASRSDRRRKRKAEKEAKRAPNEASKLSDTAQMRAVLGTNNVSKAVQANDPRLKDIVSLAAS